MPKQNVMDQSGHTPHEWDKVDVVKVKEAEARFKDLTGRGFTAFTPGEGGGPGTLLRKFDPNVEETTFFPALQGG